MAAIRGLDAIAKKWARVAGQSQQSYEDGVTDPLNDYAKGAEAGNDAWKVGTQAAIAGNRFVTGVKRAGTAKWSRNAKAKGPARFAQGVGLAEADFNAGFAPYREAIAGASLPARGPRRSPQNLQRVTAIVNAISAKKEALLKG